MSTSASLGPVHGPPLPVQEPGGLTPGGLTPTGSPGPPGAARFSLGAPLEAFASPRAEAAPTGPLRVGDRPEVRADALRAASRGRPAEGEIRQGSAPTAGPLRAPATPEAAGAFGRVIADLRTDERRLDQMVRRAMRGSPMEPEELLAMQSLVYRYSQRVELFSKLVERVTGAVRQTLQTQL